jgi:hypothetical protein
MATRRTWLVRIDGLRGETPDRWLEHHPERVREIALSRLPSGVHRGDGIALYVSAQQKVVAIVRSEQHARETPNPDPADVQRRPYVLRFHPQLASPTVSGAPTIGSLGFAPPADDAPQLVQLPAGVFSDAWRALVALSRTS